MAHKYVLVSVRYDGDEPKMYGPDFDGEADILHIISVEEQLITALRKADWNDKTEWIDVAFIQDGNTFEPMWKRWTWLHLGEVLKYYLWRVFISTWRFLGRLGN